MHFQAQMTVVLHEPIKVIDEADAEDIAGYIIMIGVNAPDIVTAAKYAHEVALRPKQADGSFREYDGIVDHVEIRRIEKEDWDDAILEGAKKIDQEGVYYSTGLIFFGPDE